MGWVLTSGSGDAAAVSLTAEGELARVTVRGVSGDWEGTGSLDPAGTGTLRATAQAMPFYAVRTAQGVEVWLEGEVFMIRPAGGAAGPAGASSDTVLAPMPGMIVRVAAEIGQEVAEGDALLVMESMKMQLTLTAPQSGRVAELCAEVGRMVDQGALLARVDAVKP